MRQNLKAVWNLRFWSLEFKIWNLEFVCDLEFGTWCFTSSYLSSTNLHAVKSQPGNVQPIFNRDLNQYDADNINNAIKGATHGVCVARCVHTAPMKVKANPA